VNRKESLRETYRAFNERDIDAVLELVHPDVDWPNAWEGGRVVGRDAVREYWIRQFAQISSHLEPRSFIEEPDGAITVLVDQIVRDASSGDIIGESRVRHRYWFDDADLVTRMDVLGDRAT
jgi:ketosteroid isomerase-like protein